MKERKPTWWKTNRAFLFESQQWNFCESAIQQCFWVEMSRATRELEVTHCALKQTSQIELVVMTKHLLVRISSHHVYICLVKLYVACMHGTVNSKTRGRDAVFMRCLFESSIWIAAAKMFPVIDNYLLRYYCSTCAACITLPPYGIFYVLLAEMTHFWTVHTLILLVIKYCNYRFLCIALGIVFFFSIVLAWPNAEPVSEDDSNPFKLVSA